jgi:hypothetical protein
VVNIKSKLDIMTEAELDHAQELALSALQSLGSWRPDEQASPILVEPPKAALFKVSTPVSLYLLVSLLNFLIVVSHVRVTLRFV